MNFRNPFFCFALSGVNARNLSISGSMPSMFEFAWCSSCLFFQCVKLTPDIIVIPMCPSRLFQNFLSEIALCAASCPMNPNCTTRNDRKNIIPIWSVQ